MPPESPSVIQDMSKYRTTTTDNEGGRATKGHLHKKTEKHENSVNASIQQNAEHSFQVYAGESLRIKLLMRVVLNAILFSPLFCVFQERFVPVSGTLV